MFTFFLNNLDYLLIVCKTFCSFWKIVLVQIPIYILSLHIFQLMIIFMRKKDWITIVKCEILTHIHIKLCKILNLEHILYICFIPNEDWVRPMKHFVLENINLKIYNVYLNWKSWKYYIYITNIYFACLFVCMFITY